MKRLVILALLAGACLAPGQAHAASVPCWKTVVNDWYGDGKIASNYPLHCYNEAYSHLGTDAKIYSSLGDDIKRALAAAVAREAGKSVPEQVGLGVRHRTPTTTSTGTDTTSTTTDTTSTTPVTVAADDSSSDSSGIPLPLIVLGGLALVLVATGAVGAAVRRRRTNP